MFIPGDYVRDDEYPEYVLEVLGTAACDEHPKEDHESLLVWHPVDAGDVWICELQVTG